VPSTYPDIQKQVMRDRRTTVRDALPGAFEHPALLNTMCKICADTGMNSANL